jgi:hypothetical protein
MVLFLSMDDSVRNRSVPNRTMGFRKSFHREGTEVGEYTIREVHHMYAIIKTGGKQYRVQEGDVLNVEKAGCRKRRRSRI